MASLTGDWDDIIDKAEEESFVGREQELNTFRQEINRIHPRYLIFYITGQRGVGKTTLLNRYRDIAKEADFLVVTCNERQRDVLKVLGHFAHLLAERGFSLKQFNARYKTYRQKIHEIENDPEAPQGLAALLGQMVARGAFIGGNLLLGGGKELEFLPSKPLETQASEWTTYLFKKLTHKDVVELVREPVPILSSLFFQELNEIAKKQQVLLCFDSFDATSQVLQEWLLQLHEYKPSQNIRIAVAGRDLSIFIGHDQLEANKIPLRRVTLTIRLDVFTEQEAENFLDSYGIVSAKRRMQILEYSGRVPLLMNWLLESESYKEALSDIGRFIAFDKNNIYAIASRGQIYQALERYEESLVDFDRVITLDENYAWAYAGRGETHRLMKHYPEALADFDRAIALDEKLDWAIASRGEIYQAMERYEEALADFGCAIALDNQSAWMIVGRGETYQVMKRYEEALTDFNRAIALDEKDTRAIAQRGITYGKMERNEEALADFDRAIALDESNDWYRYRRALVYFHAGRIDDYESDLRVAIELVQTSLPDAPNDWQMNFNLALYKLAAGHADAEVLYYQLTSTCSLVPILQEAIDDLDEFLTIQPSQESIQHVNMRLRARVNELQSFSKI